MKLTKKTAVKIGAGATVGAGLGILLGTKKGRGLCQNIKNKIIKKDK